MTVGRFVSYRSVLHSIRDEEEEEEEEEDEEEDEEDDEEIEPDIVQIRKGPVKSVCKYVRSCWRHNINS